MPPLRRLKETFHPHLNWSVLRGLVPDNNEGTSTSADGVAASEGVTTRDKHRSKVRVNGARVGFTNMRVRVHR